VGGRLIRLPLVLLSGAVGGLALISGLGLCPPLDAASLGLDEWGCFLVLAGGAYLVAMFLYAAWRTRWLRDLDTACWDARLAAYACIVAGGALVLGTAAAVVVVALATLVASVFAGLVLAVLYTLLTRMDSIHQTEGNRVD
jgi:hypothetical protein